MATGVGVGDINTNFRDLNASLDFGAKSRAESGAYISPVNVAGLVTSNMWATLGVVLIATAGVVLIFRGKK